MVQEGYRSLLGSIDLLVSNQIIHNGLNLDTILFYKRPILTNFTFSIDVQNTAFNWSQYFLQRKLTRFCPVEFYLLQYQVTNNQVLSVYNIETIIKQFLKDQPEIITGLDLNKDFKYFDKYANKTFSANIEEALKYCKTWDNYAISIVFLRILIGLHKSIIKVNNKVNNKFIILFIVI